MATAFAADAVASGAVAIVTDHPLDDVTVPQIVVDDTRLRVGPLAAMFAGHPSRSLITVGITGTNGKTTTAQLIEAIFVANGWRTGVIGTLHGPRTTPEAPDLQRALRGFVDDGADAAVLEVSSHALALHRVDGTEFDAVVFTNLGRDHLDLHGSQEEYFRAKARLFSPDFAPLAVINVDDTHGRLLADTVASTESGRELRVVPVSVDQITDVVVEASSHRYRWRGHRRGGAHRWPIQRRQLARSHHHRRRTGHRPSGRRRRSADRSPPCPGDSRSSQSSAADDRGFTVIVDYAHTPDGLAEVLASARAVADPRGAVVVVFGCGGGRDRPKRPEMGRVAAELADRVIVTSDNPRGERPEAIIGDIIEGVPSDRLQRVVIEPDRRNAIDRAIAGAQRGDVVVLAGKGHERTQEFADHTIDFDDRRVAAETLEALT